MPNTLVHYAVQGPASRFGFREADLRWLLLGCIIPDVPWILQRVAPTVVPGVDPYQLRLYATAQASLILSIFLCAAASLLSRDSKYVFLLLTANAGFHLLLDALQTKWGNGVHLLAPVSWEMWNVGLLWPEHAVFIVLSVIGLLYVVVDWNVSIRKGQAPEPQWDAPEPQWPAWRKVLLAAGLLGVYAFVPLLMLEDVRASGSHHVDVLENRDGRVGERISLDRESYRLDHGRPVIITDYDEELYVRGDELPARPATVSLRGRFVARDTLLVERLHVHRGGFRDGASIVGLLLALAVWGFWLSGRFIRTLPR